MNSQSEATKSRKVTEFNHAVLVKTFEKLFGIDLKIRLDGCLVDENLQFLLPQLGRIERDG